MSSHNIAERLGLTDEVKELKIGKSFGKGGDTYFHTFRYDFKPASVDPKKMATVDIGEGNQVTVTVPHVDKGSGSTHTVFKGSKKPYQKECVLIIDHETGEIKLEKLEFNVQLKKFRAEGSSKIKPLTIDNIGPPPPGSKKSPPVQKHSPQPKYNWSSSHYSPVPKCSPLPKSPNSQSSPPSQSSPTVPSIVPPVSNATANLRHFAQVPLQDDDDDDDDDNHNAPVPVSDGDIEMLTAELRDVKSSSSGDDSSSSSSSESESSDEETVIPNRMLDKPENSDYSPQKDLPNGTMNFSKPVNRPIVNKFDSQPSVNGLPNMPQFSQLSQDLQLSESDSDE